MARSRRFTRGLLAAVLVAATLAAPLALTFTLAKAQPATPTDTPTNTPTDTPTNTPTDTPTNTPTDTSTPTATSACSLTPTPSPYSSLAVLINELGWAGTIANSADEWVELYYPGTACPLNLNGWRLEGTSSGVTRFNITFTSSDVIQAGGYFVIAKNVDTFQNVAIDKTDGTLNLLDGGETIYLFGPSDEIVDTANFSTAGTAFWPAGSSSSRASMERYRPTTDTRTNWVTYAGPTTPTSSAPKDRNGNVVRGTPGKANWAAAVTITPSPVPTKVRTPTPRPPTPFAHMVINEFLPRAGTDWNRDGAVNVLDEFIEVKNLGPINVDLQGWQLDDEVGQGSAPYTLPSVKLKPDERAVFYGSQTHILLDDSGDSVRLINNHGVVIDVRTYGVVADPDQSHCRIPDGYYWRHPCFPTPGTENELTGSLPAPPPNAALHPPPCLLADTVPAPFREAECSPFGADIFNRALWDLPAGQEQFPVRDTFVKWRTIVE